MVSQRDFPDKWSCDSPHKSVRVDVRVGNGEEVSDQAETAIARVGESLPEPFPDLLDMTQIAVRGVPQLSELYVTVVDENGDDYASFTLGWDEVTYVGDGYVFTVPDRNVPEGATIRVDNAVSYEWIEIPTTEVEQWVEKGEAAEVQRTTKVTFPTEWGDDTDTVKHNSPRQLIDGFEPTDAQPFMLGRVWWTDDNGNDVVSHLGWLGGIGAASQSGQSKFWLYDFAELLSSVPVGETFSSPTVRQASERIAEITNNNTPIPVEDVRIIEPETEEQLSRLASQVLDDELEGAVGPRIIGDDPQGPMFSVGVGEGETTVAENGTVITASEDAGQGLASITIGTGADAVSFGDMEEKSFVANHDTLHDMYTWLGENLGSKVHFEPGPTSVTMVVDIGPSRRTFAQAEAALARGDDFRVNGLVDVRQNTALYEMKPTNTLHLRGSTEKGVLDPTQDFLESTADDLLGSVYNAPAEKYPVVKVQVPALVEAAEGAELSPEVYESGASSLDAAEAEARRELTKLLEEPSEGEIRLDGAPYIMPYDRLDAFETCQDHIQFEQTPVTYEIESVKHTKSSSSTFETELRVSVWANEKEMETVRKEMVEVGGDGQQARGESIFGFL